MKQTNENIKIKNKYIVKKLNYVRSKKLLQTYRRVLKEQTYS